jgi:thiol-disulfide isomerase/thioredoxin
MMLSRCQVNFRLPRSNMSKLELLCCTVLSLLASPSQALGPPGLPPGGDDAYRADEKEQGQRAFAIAPGGAWGWSSAADSTDSAQDKAMSACQENTHQKCVMYAINSQIVFNAKSWPLLWGPYATAALATKASSGNELGQRMVDIAYRDAQGKPAKLSNLPGKVIVLHFWGSWCPPCRKELPDLAKLQKALADRKDVVFVLLQLRESFDVAQRWAQNQHLDLPLSDSGNRSQSDTHLKLGNNASITDREIARSFPTSYVLDKHGLVVFSQSGPVQNWSLYEAFLRDVAKRSGK